MEIPDDEKAAINDLKKKDSPEGYIETLDLLFEAWLSSNSIDGSTIDERSLTLTNTKALKRFLHAI